MIHDFEKEIILNLLKNDNPYLYLGAGFSYGSKNSAGNIIPDGKKLKEIILETIKNKDIEIYEEERNNELSTVCQALKDLDEDLYLNTIIGLMILHIREILQGALKCFFSLVHGNPPSCICCRCPSTVL